MNREALRGRYRHGHGEMTVAAIKGQAVSDYLLYKWDASVPGYLEGRDSDAGEPISS